MREYFHMFIFGVCVMIFIVVTTHFSITAMGERDRRDEVMMNELTDLFAWNYHETGNPTKRIRLEKALQRLAKVYGCPVTAMPDLRTRCKGPNRDIWKRLNSLLEETK